VATNRDITKIDINRSLILIERGRLRQGEVLLNELLYRQGACRESEQKIVTPLIKGYLGFVAQLSGRNADAERLYQESIKGLEATRQMRALAIFQMRRAAMFDKTLRGEAAKIEVEKAIHSADAASQLDVLWRARLLKVGIAGFDAKNVLIIEQALVYAQKAGLHRVTVEAFMMGAGIAARNKNFERAADLTARAMTTANRYGMTLRKISLRINMGKILLAKGEASGEILLARAISHADRIGFQSAIQPAQEALLNYAASGSDFSNATIAGLHRDQNRAAIKTS
jgi:hypothetical protein